jgi:hypothetical protein
VNKPAQDKLLEHDRQQGSGAQIDPICAAQSMITEIVLAAQNGGSGACGLMAACCPARIDPRQDWPPRSAQGQPREPPS